MDSAVAASAVSTSLAIDKLVSLITRESGVLKGVEPSEIDSLRDELEGIKCYLEGVDVISARDKRVKNWLKEIKVVVEMITDLMDGYFLQLSQRSSQRGFIKFLVRDGRLIGTSSTSRPNLALNIQTIIELLCEIKERSRVYRIEFNRKTIVERYHVPQFVSPMLEECIMGFDSVKTELTERLIEGATRRSVISIVGASGMGKTTLAKKIYDNQVVSKHFDFQAWMTVSQSCSVLELLKIMAMQMFPGEIHDIEEVDKIRFTELITTLRQYLESKRYMLVFDDVWQVEVWLIMKHALPDNDKGSRIIITTRSDTVVNAFSSESSFDHIHNLEPLSEAMSRDLFRRLVFQDNQCPPQLEQLSFEFERLCEGLPLAIVAIAGLLSTKEKLVLEWKRLLDSMRVQIQSYPELANVSIILDHSFCDLPSQLKLCFLYFRIFPKDSLIPNEKLVQLWIAEGFVQEQRGLTLEKIAEGYLNELIRRNMVQAYEGFYESEKFFRVHDLMHEIVREKAYEFSFCQIWDSNSSVFGRKIHRLSIYNKIENVLESIEDSQIRSIFLFNIGALENSFVLTLFERYKLLILLDFENVPLKLLPDELGNLIHLKYLNLKNTKLRRLPKSVAKLHNLQTLDLRNTLLIELPIEINKLQNLRHLLACGYDNRISLNSTQGMRIKEGFGCLENLQTLVTVDAHLSNSGLIRELEKLRGLRRLAISRLTAEVASALCAYITQMSYLESLSLYSVNNYVIFDLHTISSPHLSYNA